MKQKIAKEKHKTKKILTNQFLVSIANERWIMCPGTDLWAQELCAEICENCN